MPGGSDSNVLKRMTAAIAHRGPDDSGFYVDERAAIGHRRLSIIDVAGGHQPMTNETGSLLIVYNGEIFNHADLRPDLERAGHRYQSHCDTETILHSYEQYGADCVTRFRGMFAFAIWDKERQTCSVRATGWGSSRSTISGTDALSRSRPKSRPFSSILRFRRGFVKARCPSTWHSGMSAGEKLSFGAFAN